MRVLKNCFEQIISPENLWRAWLVYRRGKRHRQDVHIFEKNLEENLIQIQADLFNGTYRHGRYMTFTIHDPKERTISTAPIRDHIIHQAAYSVLYQFYDTIFLPFSFSSRVQRGTSKAILLFQKYLRQQSVNFTRPCWILHGDIEKCFDSIEQSTLFALLQKRIHCKKTLALLAIIIGSYDSGRRYSQDSTNMVRGMPLGNVTSQLFINIILHELDVFAKEILVVEKYLRYSDDFLLIFPTQNECLAAASDIRCFLWSTLRLSFPQSHEKIKELSQGIEALGFCFRSHYSTIRPSTMRRMKTHFVQEVQRYANGENSSLDLNASWQSYKGMLLMGNNYNLQRYLLQQTHLSHGII